MAFLEPFGLVAFAIHRFCPSAPQANGISLAVESIGRMEDMAAGSHTEPARGGIEQGEPVAFGTFGGAGRVDRKHREEGGNLNEISALRGLSWENSRMDGAPPTADLDTLNARLAQQDQLIEVLRFEIAQLKRLLFGRRSEQLEKPLDPDQLPLWSETPEDAPGVSPVTFKTVVTSPAKSSPKRTALPAHLPHEIVVLPLSPEEGACPGCGSDRDRL